MMRTIYWVGPDKWVRFFAFSKDVSGKKMLMEYGNNEAEQGKSVPNQTVSL